MTVRRTWVAQDADWAGVTELPAGKLNREWRDALLYLRERPALISYRSSDQSMPSGSTLLDCDQTALDTDGMRVTQEELNPGGYALSSFYLVRQPGLYYVAANARVQPDPNGDTLRYLGILRNVPSEVLALVTSGAPGVTYPVSLLCATEWEFAENDLVYAVIATDGSGDITWNWPAAYPAVPKITFTWRGGV